MIFEFYRFVFFLGVYIPMGLVSYLSVLSICLYFVYLSIYLWVQFPIGLPNHLFIYLRASLSVCLYITSSLYILIYPSVYLHILTVLISTILFIHLHTHLSILPIYIFIRKQIHFHVHLPIHTIHTHAPHTPSYTISSTVIYTIRVTVSR